MSEFLPTLPNRSRYAPISSTLAWYSQKMAAGKSFTSALPIYSNGQLPTDADPNKNDDGEQGFYELFAGGIFALFTQASDPVRIFGVDNPGGATLTLKTRARIRWELSGSPSGTPDSERGGSRAFPASFPFTLGAGETLCVTGGATGSKVGVLARIMFEYE
jgi:hypothetical protein